MLAVDSGESVVVGVNTFKVAADEESSAGSRALLTIDSWLAAVEADHRPIPTAANRRPYAPNPMTSPRVTNCGEA